MSKVKMNGVRLYFRYIRMNILSQTEYKGWWLSILQTFLTVITDPISTILMFSRFGSIGEWTMPRILLMYAMAVTSFGLAECTARGFDSFPWRMVQGGEFDRLLLRPRPLTLQVAASAFHLHRLARVFSGLIAIFWCLVQLGVGFTPLRLFLMVWALAGGCVMYSGVFILTSGLSFFTVRGLDWIYILTNASYQVPRVPVEYMPKALKTCFTFLLPVIVISYYPASAICGWGEPLWKGLLALPAGLLFMALSLGVWRFGVRHYRSTGS